MIFSCTLTVLFHIGDKLSCFSDNVYNRKRTKSQRSVYFMMLQAKLKKNE